MTRKLVVFGPAEALDDVREALFAAGAGRIGPYERCAWYIIGTASFRALPGANPATGRVGQDEHVPEFRLETTFPKEKQAVVIAAMRRAHPYEEPAFNIYELL